MARKKTMADILKSEKYMDDAISDAFLFLHKAAKRKSEYIWADKGFSSLDCIYNSPSKLETCKTPDYTNENRNPKEDSKLYCEASSAVKKNEKKTVYFVKESKYTDLINGKLVSNTKTSELTESKETANKLCESSVNQNIRERKQEIGSKNSEKPSFPDINPVETANGKQSLFKSELTCDFGNGMSAYAVALNKNMKSSKDESEIKNNYQRSKMNNVVPDRKFNERSKRKRQFSYSVNSLFPEQKHLENQKYAMENQKSEKENDLLKSMLLLKISNCDQVFDFILKQKEFENMMKRFPKLEDVLPEIDKKENDVEFSAGAVKVVFGFLCCLPYDSPDERTSVEVLAALKSWGMDKFRTVFLNKFIADLKKKSNTKLAYRAAVHYKLREICDILKRFSDDDLSCDSRSYKKRKCSISVSTYIEPQDFDIPLKTETATPTLHDNFEREIRNEISFKAIGGSYIITGFHILLENLENKCDTGLSDLTITSEVVRKKQNYHEELEIRKPLRPRIAINFKKKLEVDPDETVEITVETRIKPYLCSAIQDNNITVMNDGQFCMNLKSNFKVSNSSGRRFFIGKLLYYPKPSHI